MTELGISMFAKALQLLNALSPIVVTVLGIVTLVKPTQPKKAQRPILERPVKYSNSLNDVIP